MRHDTIMLLYLDQKNNEQKPSFIKTLKNQDYLYHSSAIDKSNREKIKAIIGANANINSNVCVLKNPQNMVEIARTDTNYNGEKHFEQCKINLNDYNQIPSFTIPTSNLCLVYDFDDSTQNNIIAFTIDIKGNNTNGKTFSDFYKDTKIVSSDVLNESDIRNVFNSIFPRVIKQYEIEKINENNLVNKRVYNFYIYKYIDKFLNYIYSYIGKVAEYSYLAYYLVSNFCLSFTIIINIFNSVLTTICIVLNEIISLLFGNCIKAKISDRNNCNQNDLKKIDKHLSFIHRLQKLFLKFLLNSQRNMFTLHTYSLFDFCLAYIYSVYDTWKENFTTVLSFAFILGVAGNNITLVYTFYIFITNGHLYKLFLGFLSMLDLISKKDYEIKTSDFEKMKNNWLKQNNHCISGKKANTISRLLDEKENTLYNTFSIETQYCNNDIVMRFINPALLHHYLPCKLHVVTKNMYKDSLKNAYDFNHYKTQDIAQLVYMLGK